MLHNVGKIDRIIRIILALILATLFFTKIIDGTWGTIAIISAGILFMTGLRSCCPIYAVLGFGTCGIDTRESDRKVETGKLDLK
jgi:hypothetical protein